MSGPVLGGQVTIAEELDFSVGEVVFDKTHSFGPTLQWTFSVWSGAGATTRKQPAVERRLLNGHVLRLGYTVLASFREVDSRSEPLVQAADVLAAVMAVMPLKSDELELEAKALVDLYAGIVSTAIADGPNPHHLAESEQFYRHALRPFARRADPQGA